METITNEITLFCDVDGTLTTGRFNEYRPGDITIVNPYTNQTVFTKANFPNIDLMKEMKSRGYYVVVWSAGGAAWARVVIEALGLEDNVDTIITKPIAYIDDQLAEQFMKNRIFLTEKDRA